MKKRLLMPLNLQYFADPEGDGESEGQAAKPAADPNPTDSENPADPDKKGEEGKTFTRDDVAKMIAAETKKAVTSAEEKWRAEKDEAKKLAEMDEKEKTDYEKQKLQEEIDNLKREKTLAEMANTATSMLADKGIKANEGILSFVVKDSAEGTSESVKTFVDLINVEREAIKEDFEKRLGSKMPLDGTTSTTLSRGAQMAKEINNQTKKPETDPWATN